MLTRNAFDFEVDRILKENSYLENDYFLALINKEMSKEQFIKTQLQFYYAVVHFVVPLSYTAASIPTYTQRLNIIKNIWEEHGEGDLNQTHGSTFTEFLKRLTQNSDITIPASEHAVNLFNGSLNQLTRDEHFLTGVAVMGMIERMFADISASIGTEVIALDWLKKEKMIHYTVHQELDCIHAEDFFSILRPYYSEENSREIINAGLKAGATTFLAFYSNLWLQAKVE